MSATDSGQAHRRRTRSEQNSFYERAVDLSLRIFDEVGYDAFSMRRLAAAIGVPPMSLYRYFPSKRHLMRHIWEALLLRAYRYALTRVGEESSPYGRLCAYLDGYLQYWLDHRDDYRVVFTIRESAPDSAGHDDATLSPDPHRFLETLMQLIAACIGEERTDGTQVRYLAEALFCKVLGVLTGVISMDSLVFTDVQALKRRLVFEMIDQVRRVDSPTVGPVASSAGSPASGS